MKRILATTCLTLGLAFAANAYADPIPTGERDPNVVYEWGYKVKGIFTEWSTKDYDGNSLGTGRVGDNNNTGVSYGYKSARDAEGNLVFSNQRIASNEAVTELEYTAGSPEKGNVGYTSLRWGNPGGGWTPQAYSSIGIEDISGQTVATDNPDLHASTGVSLWHNNKPITDGSGVGYLTSGTVLLTLNLTPDMDSVVWENGVADPDLLAALEAVGATTFATELNFHFIETPNRNNEWVNDIFILEDPFTASKETFNIGGVDYTFTFGASFEPLKDGYMQYAQEAIGSEKTLYGWVTTEDGFTGIPTYLSVHYKTDAPPYPTPTPEPGTVALMGLGLLGLAGASRRRKK